MKKSSETSSKQFNILTDFYNRIKPIVAPPEKKEEKSTETMPVVSVMNILKITRRMPSPRSTKVSG